MKIFYCIIKKAKLLPFQDDAALQNIALHFFSKAYCVVFFSALHQHFQRLPQEPWLSGK